MGKNKITKEKRWEILGLIKAGGFSNRKIAKMLEISVKCVRTTRANYETLGSPLEKSRKGRGTKLSYRKERWLYRLSRKHSRWSYKDMADEFNQTFKRSSITRYTVRNVLKRFKIMTYLAIRKPMLTVRDRLKRLKWAKQRRYWDVEDWANVIFSDESNFEVFNRKGRVFVKRLRAEKYSQRFVIPRLQGGGGSAGIWGCISHKGSGCCYLYTGRVNQYSYIRCLEDALLPSADLFYDHQNYIFMQDGAPAHTAHTVKDWLDENDIRLLDWCPRSPDLNPIENIWAYMDTHLARINITSVEHLKEVLRDVWLKIPHELVMRLIESMPRRVRACIQAKGGHFKY